MDIEEMRRVLTSEMESAAVETGGEWAVDPSIARERFLADERVAADAGLKQDDVE
jgi:hypothetical protein